MSNPFDTEEDTSQDTGDTDADAESEQSFTDPEGDLDVDSGSDDDDEVEEVTAVTPTGKPVKSASKESSRPPVPEGFISPVAAAKKLGEHLTAKARETDPNAPEVEVRPQVVYSYIKNSQGGKNPIPTYEEGGRSKLLKLDEFLAWWDEKDARVAASKANAAAKAAKKAEKAKAAPAAEATEAEGSEPEGELVEAE